MQLWLLLRISPALDTGMNAAGVDRYANAPNAAQTKKDQEPNNRVQGSLNKFFRLLGQGSRRRLGLHLVRRAIDHDVRGIGGHEAIIDKVGPNGLLQS